MTLEDTKAVTYCTLLSVLCYTNSMCNFSDEAMLPFLFSPLSNVFLQLLLVEGFVVLPSGGNIHPHQLDVSY